MDCVCSISLNFIKSIDEEMRMASELIFALKNMIKPGEFLEKLPEYKSIIDSLDSKITINKNNISYLVSAYKMRMMKTRELLGKYKEELSAQLDKNDQVYSMDSFYNEERQLSKYHYRDYETDPSMYSMMAIVKRILNDEVGNIESLENATGELESLYKWYIDCQSYILNIKCAINEKAFVDKFMGDYLSADGEAELTKLLRFIGFIKDRLNSAKNFVTSIFQRMDALENDYKIYDMVVNKFVSVANESYFSAGTVVSGII